MVLSIAFDYFGWVCLCLNCCLNIGDCIIAVILFAVVLIVWCWMWLFKFTEVCVDCSMSYIHW